MVLGYHGCDKDVAETILAGKAEGVKLPDFLCRRMNLAIKATKIWLNVTWIAPFSISFIKVAQQKDSHHIIPFARHFSKVESFLQDQNSWKRPTFSGAFATRSKALSHISAPEIPGPPRPEIRLIAAPSPAPPPPPNPPPA